MSGKKRNVMLFVLLFTLLLGVIVPVQAQSYGSRTAGQRQYGWRIVRTQTLLIKAAVEYTRDMEWNI